jgi:hypothetical protein
MPNIVEQEIKAIKLRLDQIEKARPASLQDMTQDQLNAILTVVQDEIEERKLDKIWQETHDSLEAVAYATKRRAEALEEHARGETVKHVRGKSLAELLHEEV